MNGALAEDSSPASSQFRIRDLLLVTLAVGVLLGLGRAFGGEIGPSEVGLLAIGTISIGVAAFFLRRRGIWGVCLAASFLLPVIIAPAPWLARLAIGAVMASHFFFAAIPVLAIGPRHRRWPWVAAAVACQLAAALFTPSDPISMMILAAPLSWLVAVAALVWRYRRIRRPTPPSDAVPDRR